MTEIILIHNSFQFKEFAYLNSMVALTAFFQP